MTCTDRPVRRCLAAGATVSVRAAAGRSGLAALALGVVLSAWTFHPRAGWSQGLAWRAPDHAGQVVFRSPEMVVTIVDRGQRLPGSAGDVVVVVEADPRQGAFGSLRSRMDIDCNLGRVLLQQAERFSQPGLAGKGQLVVSKPQWVRPMPSAYLAKVIIASCGGSTASSEPSHTYVAEGAAQVSAAAAPATTTKLASNNAAPARAIDRPKTTLAPSPKPSTSANSTPAPPPLAKAEPRPANASIKPIALMAEARTVKAPTKPAAITGGATVQILSSPNPEAARKALRLASQAHPSQMNGKSTQITQTKVNGATFYRARIGGFADSKAAQQFCATLKAGGSDCFVVGQGG